jgi:hypothetical protein
LRAVGTRMLKMTARATIEWWGEELSAAVVMGYTSALTGDSPESLLQRTQDELDRSRAAASVRPAAAANAGSSSSH